MGAELCAPDLASTRSPGRDRAQMEVSAGMVRLLCLLPGDDAGTISRRRRGTREMRLPAHALPAVFRGSFAARGGGLGAGDGRPWHWLTDADPRQLQSHDAEFAEPDPFRSTWPRPAPGSVHALATPLSGRKALRGTSVRPSSAWWPDALMHNNCRRTRHSSNRSSTARSQTRSLTIRVSLTLAACGPAQGPAEVDLGVFHGLAQEFPENGCPGFLLSDTQLARWPGGEDGSDGASLVTTSLWNVSTQFESKVLHALTPDELREAAPALAAEGYRPASISAAGGGPGRLHADHLRLVSAAGSRGREGPTGTAPGQCRRRLAQARRGTQGVADASPSPRSAGRRYLIHRMGPLGADPNRVLDQTEKADDVSIRRP